MSFGSFGSSLGTAAAATPFFGPLAPVVGGIAGGVADLVIGGNARARAKRSNDKSRRKNLKYQKKVWRFDRDQRKKKYKYDKKTRDIAIENYEADRQYQMDIANQRRDFELGIQDFQYNQQLRAYEKSLETRDQQLEFNDLASQQAYKQQIRYMTEQMESIAFDEQQTLLNFVAAQAGLSMTKAQAGIKAGIQKKGVQLAASRGLDVAATQAAFGRQRTNIQALKARGQAQAAVQAGRSAGKVQQAIGAEAGAAKAQINKELELQQREVIETSTQNQRDIVAQLLFTEADADLKLLELDNQLELDQAKIEASRANLIINDQFVRRQIGLQKKQADMNARAQVMLQPERMPVIPEVIELPKRRFQKVFKPKFYSPQPAMDGVYNPGASFASNLSDILGNPQVQAGVVSGIGALFPQNTPDLSGSQNVFSTVGSAAMTGAMPTTFNYSSLGSSAFPVDAPSLFNNPYRSN